MVSSISKCCFILIFSFTLTYAQEKPSAVLIDKFGILGCEDIWQRQDFFFTELQKSLNSIGYIVIYGKKDATRQNLAREKLVTGIIGFRNFDKERLIIVRGKESEDPHTEFWLVPAGADKPNFDEAKWNLTFSKSQKPFIYYASKGDFNPCPGAGNMKIYSEYLTENPQARANVVIYAKSKAKFQKEKKILSNELIKNYKIPPKRIKFFFEKEISDYENYELWLVP